MDDRCVAKAKTFLSPATHLEGIHLFRGWIHNHNVQVTTAHSKKKSTHSIWTQSYNKPMSNAHAHTTHS